MVDENRKVWGWMVRGESAVKSNFLMSGMSESVELGKLSCGGALEKENIKQKVLADKSGVYLLSTGRKNDQDQMVVEYVGRGVVGEVEDLCNRLIAHVGDPAPDEQDPSTGTCIYKYFWFQYENTPLESYYSECRYYHHYGANKYLRNKIHPAKNKGSNRLCPVCKQ